MMLELASKQIKAEEGLRLIPYMDTVGKLTIGYGRNLDDRGISKGEAEMMLANDLALVLSEINAYSWFGRLSMARKAALVNLHFNLGAVRFAGFRNMIAALEARDYQAAADELINSHYATQVPARAQRIYQNMIEG